MKVASVDFAIKLSQGFVFLINGTVTIGGSKSRIGVFGSALLGSGFGGLPLFGFPLPPPPLVSQALGIMCIVYPTGCVRHRHIIPSATSLDECSPEQHLVYSVFIISQSFGSLLNKES